ncbi:hypothetical protein Pmani_036703 [Petrolisthes manimaculis]|uniref:Kinesin-like protein n=1 Tax=Petrolisthes manimaculis TaxID=1843537 RepID=A0AAE1TM58_9EUCA|nr:hypothetical protein Pmani_036703 [Petrolisthes manimaculis]
MKCLEHGAMNHATGATAMNAHSSRSHAIFSLHIQQRNSKKDESIVSSKFHLVNLAGSERAKKTGATGVREDPKGGIKIVGLTEIPVTSLEETMKCLEHGAMNHATGATAMNAHSSRSHAIFSLHIQQRNSKKDESIVSSKFHLVNLAGSERAKKTGATGVREDPKGGIKIVGLTEIPVTSLEETMKCLEHGAMNHATGATAMNAHSSRSHAIFSLHIQQRNSKKDESIVSSKFHLVNLAGSERAKKTGATGVSHNQTRVGRQYNVVYAKP